MLGQPQNLQKFCPVKISCHMVVVLPMGSGKSVCSTALPWIFDAMQGTVNQSTVVVAPLYALMKDKVDFFRGRRLPSVFVNSQSIERESLLCLKK